MKVSRGVFFFFLFKLQIVGGFSNFLKNDWENKTIGKLSWKLSIVLHFQFKKMTYSKNKTIVITYTSQFIIDIYLAEMYNVLQYNKLDSGMISDKNLDKFIRYF